MPNPIKFSIIVCSLMIMAASTTVHSAISKKNPYTLVYENAIDGNVLGQINIRPVNYYLRKIKIAANVYLPPGYSQSRTYPAVVVAHPNGGVKEQVAGLYAQLLAEEGFVTIVADAAYQGASGGSPRMIDKPMYRIDDIRGMADFISNYPAVDANRIGVLGISGGGAYAIKAAQTDKRFIAVATLSLIDSGRVSRNGFMDNDIENTQKKLRMATDARAIYARTGKITYFGSKTHNLSESELQKITIDLYRQGAEYYGNTHNHPNSSFVYTADSLLDLMVFDASSNLDLINQPLLMIAGANADTLYMTEDIFKKATGSQNKELYLIKDATHIETYYVKEYVDKALRKLTEFFKQNL